MPDAANDGSEVFGAYIQKELDRQIERKASLEQRALSVITTSGALVTLLFGLAALSTKQQTFVLPSRSKDLLLVSLVFFVIAIAGALAINVPLVYKHVTPEGLADAVSNRWNRQPSSARKTVARTQIDVFKSARKINGVKAWLLFGAIGAELVAVGLVAAAVGVVIYGQKPVTPSNAFAILPGWSAVLAAASSACASLWPVQDRWRLNRPLADRAPARNCSCIQRLRSQSSPAR